MGPSHAPEPETAAPDSPPPSRLDRLIEAGVRAFWSWGLVVIVIGLGIGAAAWPLAHKDDFDFIIENKLDAAKRKQMVTWMAASFVIVWSAYLGSWQAVRRRDPGRSLEAHARGINRYAFVLMLAPAMTALLHKGIETKHRFITLLLISAVTLVMGMFFYRVAPSVRSVLGRIPKQELVNRWLPRLLVVGVCVWYATRLSSLALIDHVNLGTHIWDLGIYDNLLWKTSRGEFLACVFCKGGQHTSGHFDPVLALLVPLYDMAPRAETLLIFQACWLSLGVFPIYLIASRRLGNEWFGLMLAAIYAMYPALHGANMFDFHSLTLSIPTFLWMIYFLDRGSVYPYWFSFGLLLATREDMSLLSCFAGVYAITQKRPITGIVTILLALSYLAYVKLAVMPDSGLLMQSRKSSSFIYYYEEMIPHRDEGLKGLIISFFTNPVYVLQVLTKEAKLFFFGALLVPLIGLPLIGGAKRIIMVYGLIFIGLASRKYVYSLHFQYSTVLFPIMIASVPDAVARLRDSEFVRSRGIKGRRLAYTLMLASVLATALTSMKFGALRQNESFHAGWNKLAWKTSKKRAARYKVLRRLVAQIEPEASVCTMNEVGPHVSARAEAAMWPRCKNMDYLLLHTKRFKKNHKRRLQRMVNRGQYRLVDGGEGLSLYERVPDDERAEARKAAREAEKARKRKEQEEKKRQREAARKKGKTGKPVITPTPDDDEEDRPDDEAEKFRQHMMGPDPDEPDEGGDTGGADPAP